MYFVLINVVIGVACILAIIFKRKVKRKRRSRTLLGRRRIPKRGLEKKDVDHLFIFVLHNCGVIVVLFSVYACCASCMLIFVSYLLALGYRAFSRDRVVEY